MGSEQSTPEPASSPEPESQSESEKDRTSLQAFYRKRGQFEDLYISDEPRNTVAAPAPPPVAKKKAKPKAHPTAVKTEIQPLPGVQTRRTARAAAARANQSADTEASKSASTTIPQPDSTRVEQPVDTTIPQPENTRLPANNTLHQSENTRLEQSAYTTVPQPDNTRLEQSANITVSQPENTRLELPANTTLPQPDNISLEQSANTTLAPPDVTRPEQPANRKRKRPANTTLDEPANTRRKWPADTTIDQPNNAAHSQPGVATVIQPARTTIDQPANTIVDQPQPMIASEHAARVKAGYSALPYLSSYVFQKDPPQSQEDKRLYGEIKEKKVKKPDFPDYKSNNDIQIPRYPDKYKLHGKKNPPDLFPPKFATKDNQSLLDGGDAYPNQAPLTRQNCADLPEDKFVDLQAFRAPLPQSAIDDDLAAMGIGVSSNTANNIQPTATAKTKKRAAPRDHTSDLEVAPAKKQKTTNTAVKKRVAIKVEPVGEQTAVKVNPKKRSAPVDEPSSGDAAPAKKKKTTRITVKKQAAKSKKRAATEEASDEELANPAKKRKTKTSGHNDQVEDDSDVQAKRGLPAPPTIDSKWIGVATGHGTSSNRPAVAQLSTPWQCAEFDCASGQTWLKRSKDAAGDGAGRKVVSHFFGRNKKSTKRIPEDVLHFYCRKHYQRGRYDREKGTTADAIKAGCLGTVDMIAAQLDRIELWRPSATFEVGLMKGAADRVKRYRAVLRGGGSSAAAAAAIPASEGGPEKAFDADLLIHFATHFVKVGQTIADLRTILAWLRQEINNGTSSSVAPLEFLIDQERSGEQVNATTHNYQQWEAQVKGQVWNATMAYTPGQ